MRLNEDGLIDLLMTDGPLCPRGLMPPVHPAHQIRTDMINAAYRATPRNADGEPAAADLAKVNRELSYGESTTDRMRLYRDVALASNYPMATTVETLYFRCHICGLILPANRVPT